jgi:flagellar biosynthetic protein FlhB
MKDDSRSEPATPKRRNKARSEGSVAKSMDLNSAVGLLIAAVAMSWFGGGMIEGLKGIMITLLSQCGTHEVTLADAPRYLLQGFIVIGGLLTPLFLAVMIGGVAVNIAQTGFKITPKVAYPKFNRINPVTGIGRLFSPNSVVELFKSILKIILVGSVVYIAIRNNLNLIYSLTELPADALGPAIAKLLLHILMTAAVTLIVLGIFDFFYRRYEHETSLKMTKEEVREESKEQEGDPRVKSKIREIMIKKTIQRMMKKVPEADVVITNPIHLAVALKYDRTKSAAPIVVAKGARKVAERIKEIAREHNVPIIENKPLARALFKAVEVGDEIPLDLYKAVAEILAYVYRLKKKFFGVA